MLCFKFSDSNIYGYLFHYLLQARARLSATVREIIKERKKEKLGLEEGDFLDIILSKGSLSDEETVSIVLDILLGGYETTATLMALIVYFLAHAPDALEKLKVTLSLSLHACINNC